MLILAIDTSDEQASIALALDGRTRAELSWLAERNHSRELTPAIARLLQMEHQEPAKLSAIAVAIGPGAFSGLRVGLSAAKGIAMARRIPLIGISSLDVIAFQASPWGDDVWAVTPAGRGQVNAAHYAGQRNAWRRVDDYRLLDYQQLVGRMSSDALVAGPDAEAVVDKLREMSDIRLFHEPAAFGLRRAGYLAELGRMRLASGAVDELDYLEPLYLRRSAAEERQAGGRQE